MLELKRQSDFGVIRAVDLSVLAIAFGGVVVLAIAEQRLLAGENDVSG